MRAIWSVRPKCSHRCVSLKETSSKPVQILKHTTRNSAEQTAMRTKWFKHISDLNCSGASPALTFGSLCRFPLNVAGVGFRVKNEKSAQRGSFWDGRPADIRGSFARISRPKTSVRAVKILEKKTSISARTSMNRRGGRPRP